MSQIERGEEAKYFFTMVLQSCSTKPAWMSISSIEATGLQCSLPSAPPAPMCVLTRVFSARHTHVLLRILLSRVLKSPAFETNTCLNAINAKVT